MGEARSSHSKGLDSLNKQKICPITVKGAILNSEGGNFI